ncbi:MAG: helix-turn-helix domain-containing protein [Alphaproteobacteria bacterium]|nr:helix-turn-helix domain-containing protein [Alphaproteobacteria bacterium]
MENLSLRIPKILKSLRQEKGWSLDRASQETGVSKAMLGQIERSESSPTIATLWKIASGFNVSFSFFIQDLNQNQSMHRIGNPEQLHPKDDKIFVMPIFPYDEKFRFEVFVIELLPGCEHFSPAHQKGVVEHIIVASGELEVFVRGAWHSVKEGEGLGFEADQSHGYRNLSKQKAVFHDIIHY